MQMIERKIPLRPRRLGTRRRRELRERVLPAVGIPSARSAPRAEGASLDKYKVLLATSVHDYLQAIETPKDKYRRRLYEQAILKNTMHKIFSEGLNERRQRDFERLSNCQMEWIGFKPACCGAKPVAVPIGCNHRLCVLCNAHRTEHYRERVRSLFDRLQHPQFLTLTIPNFRNIKKRSFHRIRVQIRKLIKLHSAWCRGGIYSLETTFNRKERTWHVHAHILIDGAVNLPRSKPAFIRFKRAIEFDWLRLTGGSSWRPGDFQYWFGCTQTKQPFEWNQENRRVVDIRPVRDRQGAAFEILKYITKVSAFSDLPEAVDEFLSAVKGVRMLQTFGSWYGFKFEDDVNRSWKKLQCDCGKNDWLKIGRVFHECVEMAPDGRWHLKPEFTGWVPWYARGKPVQGAEDDKKCCG